MLGYVLPQVLIKELKVPTKIDHIVISAASLADGVQFVKDKLGVEIPKGGEHPQMGTHNHLMQLGNDTFLEVITINPEAEPPTSPRWFGLDDEAVRASVAKPRLLTWAVNTTDLKSMHSNTPFDLGKVTPLSRGDLNWLITVPDDGRLLSAGLIPYVLEWQTDVHPSINMKDLGCQLKGVHVHHPYADWYSNIANAMGMDSLVNVHQLEVGVTPYLGVDIETPTGMVQLDSRL